MYTTEGSSFLASRLNSLPSFTGLGTTSGVASGEGACPRAACTPVLRSVPMTIPMDRVISKRLKDSSFCCRITLYHRMFVFAFLGRSKPCNYFLIYSFSARTLSKPRGGDRGRHADLNDG